MDKPHVAHYTGCLLGGAVGDALGAPVEFMTTAQIRQRYGPRGVENYVEQGNGTGRFTDDTQMTLFTAEGLLRARHRAMLKGIGGALLAITYHSYLRWLHTQGMRPVHIPTGFGIYDVEGGWLLKQKGLFAHRAPGNTCLRALQSGQYGTQEAPLNNSKGCGGVMRVAPVGLTLFFDAQEAFKTGCQLAAITHGHPSGYLSAGFLAALIAYLAQGMLLIDAIHACVTLLEQEEGHEECLRAVESAIELSRTGVPTAEKIEQLGAGWVGEEALAIALYCALHFQGDFRQGVLAAVNHSGDSDSTGAIAGNILGLILGIGAIPPEWVENLDMADVVEQIAIDLHTGVRGDEYQPDQEWERKYPPY